VYVRPEILATFDARELLGDAYGNQRNVRSVGNGSNQNNNNQF
jgi:hypothetical protein